MGYNTLQQIDSVSKEVKVYSGFHARNKGIAICDILIAYTFASGVEPEGGGSGHTWGQCKAFKLHIPLLSIEG